MLGDGERALLAELGVFASGFDVDSAEAVAGEVLGPLGSLVDKSLARRAVVEERPRFELLESIREFALEQLEERNGLESARRAHAEYFLSLAERAEPELQGANQAAWLRRLGREHENLRDALGWFRERGQDEQVLRLALALGPFWEQRGTLGEPRAWLEGGLSADGALPEPVRARALYGVGRLAMLQADYDRANTALEQGLERFRRLSADQGVVRCLWELGFIALVRGDYERARGSLRGEPRAGSWAGRLRRDLAFARERRPRADRERRYRGRPAATAREPRSAAGRRGHARRRELAQPARPAGTRRRRPGRGAAGARRGARGRARPRGPAAARRGALLRRAGSRSRRVTRKPRRASACRERIALCRELGDRAGHRRMPRRGGPPRRRGRRRAGGAAAGRCRTAARRAGRAGVAVRARPPRPDGSQRFASGWVSAHSRTRAPTAARCRSSRASSSRWDVTSASRTGPAPRSAPPPDSSASRRRCRFECSSRSRSSRAARSSAAPCTPRARAWRRRRSTPRTRAAQRGHRAMDAVGARTGEPTLAARWGAEAGRSAFARYGRGMSNEQRGEVGQARSRTRRERRRGRRRSSRLDREALAHQLGVTVPVAKS